MTPFYLNPQTSSPIPFIELKGDNNHQQQNTTFQVFGYLHGDHLATSSNNSSFSYSSENRLSSEAMFSLDYSRRDQMKVEKLVLSHEKASDLTQPCASWLQSRVEDDNSGSSDYAYTINNHANNDHKYSRKWKSSKVRIMQKMMTNSKNSRDGSKQQIDNHLPKRQTNDVIRVCTDCHTTTTPLWRSGPQGPKSLCNACGIRQRKARRAAAAAAASTATVCSNDASMSHVEPLKPKGLDHDKNHTLPLKKRSKIINSARNSDNNNNNNYHTTHNNFHNNSKKICFEDFALSSNQGYLQANTKRFPRDEEEGAILLMALSCGLACS